MNIEIIPFIIHLFIIIVILFNGLYLCDEWKHVNNQLSMPYNPCQPNPCQNSAECVNIQDWSRTTSLEKFNTLSDYYCVCLKGWTGQNCTEDIDDCVIHPCLNGGICENKPNMRFYCHCPTGYVGQTCEYRDPCQLNPCLNGGTCHSDPFGQFTCICPQWYNGVRCEQEINPCYPTSPCLGEKSVCHLLTSKNRTVSGPSFFIHKSEYIVDFLCECDPDYFGRYCNKKRNLCKFNKCKNGATCLQNKDHFVCLCPSGFTGSICNTPTNTTEYLYPNVNTLIRNQSMKTNIFRKNSTENIKLLYDHCYQLGCNKAKTGDNICQAKCIYAKCLNVEDELEKDCQYWVKCLQTTEHIVNYYNKTTCVEQFKNGKCQPECNRNECYMDGFDCLQNISQCISFEFCLQSYGDGICQSQCNTIQCGYDGGDCEYEQRNNYLSIKYILLHLKTNQSEFKLNRNYYLGNLGIILQSIVRIAKDDITQELLLEDIPNKNQIKVLLEVTSQSNNSCKTTEGNMCTSDSFQLLKPNELKMYILAALSTIQYRSLFSIINLNFVDSPSQSHFKAPWELESSTDTKISKEAIGLYVCICILAGIIIILILFLVFQYDNNWRKPLKRVKTKGIWCPPVLSIYSKPNQVDLLGQQSSVYFTGLKSAVGVTEPPLTTMTINESKYFDNKLKQTPSASSFFQDYLNSSTANEKDTFLFSNVSKYNHEEMIAGLLSDKIPRTDISLSDDFSPSCKKKRLTQDKMMSDVLPNNANLFTVPKYLGNLFSEETGSFQHFGEEEKHKQRERKFDLKNRYDSLLPQENSKTTNNESLNLDSTYDKKANIKIMGSDNKEVFKIISSLDGLHPCNVTQKSRIEQVLDDNKYQNKGVEMLSNKAGTEDYLDDDLSMNIVGDQSLLHLAAHMNVGHDVINKICHNEPNQRPLGTLYVDSFGRTALTSAAAANSLESVKSLYQLEKEALLNKKPVKSVKSHQITTPKPTGRSRRRYQVCESRQCSPIIVAIQAGNDEVVKCLLDEGCPYNTIDQYGRNVVHWAAVTNSVKILAYLAQCKGFARLMNMKDDWDRTPIMLAIREGCQEAVEFLLDKQVKVEIIDCMENDCLSLCTEKGYKKIHEILINYIRSRNSDTKSITHDKKVNIFKENPNVSKQELGLSSMLQSAPSMAPVTTVMTTTPVRHSAENICRMNEFDWVSLSDDQVSEDYSDCDRFTEDMAEDFN
ncbi:unnamed protein product [Schistosoma rodhaini]|uniref:EGF-like domain-containing protein n=1 Tax=Schistosoma rodhaini TaxID=6188 RepID=A0AA85FA17_9TREM|nr:unnamed protein product [Schistosoma rodhaini]CAH8493255.1 unnamed protein product [Schistosoma rodhaini]